MDAHLKKVKEHYNTDYETISIYSDMHMNCFNSLTTLLQVYSEYLLDPATTLSQYQELLDAWLQWNSARSSETDAVAADDAAQQPSTHVHRPILEILMAIQKETATLVAFESKEEVWGHVKGDHVDVY